MLNSKQMKHHEQLVARMAETLGLDLDEEVMKAHLSEEDVQDAVLSCTGCTQPHECDHWLAAHHDVGETPDYCRNTALFHRLKALAV